jgi:ATP-binding cassette, subfamily B, bacterial
MVSNPALAGAVEQSIRGIEYVVDARANPISGSLLVSYNPMRAPQDFPETVRSVLEARLREPGFAGGSAGSVRRTTLLQVLDMARERPGERVGPALLTVGAHSLTILQGLSLASIGAVAQGGTPAALRWLGVTGPSAKVRFLTGATVLLTAGGLLVNYKRRTAWRRLSQATEHRLRDKLFLQLESQDLAFFERHGTGELMAILLDDGAKVGALLEEADVFIESALTLLFAGSALFKASPRLALIAAISVPVLLVPVRIFTPKSRVAFSERSAASSGLNQTLENILLGIVEVKSFTAEEFEAGRVRQLSENLAERSTEATAYSELQTAFGGNIFYGGYTLAMSHGAHRVLAGRMPEEQLARAGFWYPRLIASMGRISELTSAYYGARSGAERLQRTFDAKPRVTDGPIRISRTALRGDIVFNDVSFGYEPSVPVVRNLSFEVPSGSTLAIVGPTGSGKSTLLKLLLRFYDPDSGRISLDGHDLRDLHLRDLRSSIALVSQDVYLFNGTVRHNVLYGRQDASDEDVIGALAAAGAQDLLASLPKGLDQEVGERGQRLSGGQRQRVAIARALLKGAPILTLDEATSHLDYATEAAVKTSLKSATAGQTVIYVAHRLTAIRDADKIVVMDAGVLREEGTHESLLEQRGLYYNLWLLQS